MTASARIIRRCLADLGIDISSDTSKEQDDNDQKSEVLYAKALLKECDSLDDEFALVKKIYFARILEQHPDKGGDPEEFRKTRAAFEVLRDLKRKGTLSSFLVEDVGDNDMDDPTVSYYDDMYEEMYQDGATPSYEYYQAAAEETEPGYKVELAKSGRSQCDKCKKEAVIKGKTKRGKDAEAPEEETAPVAAIPAEEEPRPANTKRRNSRRSTRAVVVANKTLPDNKSSNTTAMLPHASYIPIDAVRVGSLNELSGSYGRWNHLACWRVPYRVWAGLTQPTNAKQVQQDLIDMEQILLIGVRDLPPQEMERFVQHVMQPNHWAKKINWKKKKHFPPPDLKEMRRQAAEAAAAVGKDGDQKLAAKKRNAQAMNEQNMPLTGIGDDTCTVPKKPKMETDVPMSNVMVVSSGNKKKPKFTIPSPGMDGAQDGCFTGLRFVLTGVFPQVGGGTGLNMGKDKIKGMIEAFGGIVTGSVSGKTNFLVVGKEPGASKVALSREKGIPMLDIKSLKDKIMGDLPELEHAKAPAIQSFSAGYKNNRVMD